MGKANKILNYVLIVLVIIGVAMFASGKFTSKEKQETNYPVMSAMVLNKHYEQVAKKLGTGTPKVDVDYSTVKSYESNKGCQVTKGNFYLAGNKNVTHSFGITFRQKTGAVLTLIVDGKQLYNDEKGRAEASKDK